MKDPFSLNTEKKSNSPLEWEESALDEVSDVREVLNSERIAPKIFWLAALVFAGFGVVFFRIFSLQVTQTGNLKKMSDNNRIRKVSLLAPRGLIFDRQGGILAQNSASYNLIAIPFDLPKNQGDLRAEINSLSQVISLDVPKILSVLDATNPSSLEPVIIKQAIQKEESILFETRQAEFPGFSIQKIPARQYPLKNSIAHILGYIGSVSKEQLDGLDRQVYELNDFIGKSGIEYKYEEFLHGRNGKNLIEVDAAGKLVNVLGEDEPVPGNNVFLNINKELQDVLYEKLKGGTKSARKAAAVALNPKNGEILALVSLPSFDNNLFSGGLTSDEFKSLFNDPALPLFNRAISGAYPPGSTIKPIMVAAALEQGVVKPETIIVDNGVLVIPNKYNPSQKYNFYGWKRDGLGSMDAISAVARSSDIYFYTVGGGHPNSPIKGLGAETIAEYYRKFGLGRTSGIDIPGEKEGLVADPKWKLEYFKNDPILKEWYLGDTYHISIGQGDMLTTPLQIANMTAIVANGGFAYKPRVLNRVEDLKGKMIFKSEPEFFINDLTKESLRISQLGMKAAVDYGSGVQLKSLNISSAGKTGTSQFDGSDPKRTHAWFTAYAPFENPEIVVTVLVEAGGEGHAVAVPVVKEVLKWWSENRS